MISEAPLERIKADELKNEFRAKAVLRLCVRWRNLVLALRGIPHRLRGSI